MPADHKEIAFEKAIEHHLTTQAGYASVSPDTFDRNRALFPEEVISFIRETQSDKWDYLCNIQKDKAEETLLDDLCRALIRLRPTR